MLVQGTRGEKEKREKAVSASQARNERVSPFPSPLSLSLSSRFCKLCSFQCIDPILQSVPSRDVYDCACPASPVAHTNEARGEECRGERRRKARAAPVIGGGGGGGGRSKGTDIYSLSPLINARGSIRQRLTLLSQSHGSPEEGLHG